MSIMCGLPGAGKTTRAKRLEREKPALRLSPDEWIAPLLQDASDLDELARLRAPVENLQWRVAERVLDLGTDVVLEFGFWYRRNRLDCLSRARDLDVRVELYLFEAEKEELWRRLSSRNAELPDATFHVSRGQLDRWYPLFEKPQPDELALYKAWHHVT